jgi:hypothetical protein
MNEPKLTVCGDHVSRKSKSSCTLGALLVNEMRKPWAELGGALPAVEVRSYDVNKAYESSSYNCSSYSVCPSS